jgi:hypothetical protein
MLRYNAETHNFNWNFCFAAYLFVGMSFCGCFFVVPLNTISLSSSFRLRFRCWFIVLSFSSISNIFFVHILCLLFDRGKSMHNIDSHFLSLQELLWAGKFAYQKAYRIYHVLMTCIHTILLSFFIYLPQLSLIRQCGSGLGQSLLHTRLFPNYFSSHSLF